MKRWELGQCEANTKEMDDFQNNGWEPFAINPMMKASPLNPQHPVLTYVIWFRKETEIPSAAPSIESPIIGV